MGRSKVFVGCRLYSGFMPRVVHEAFVVFDGKVIFCGSREEALSVGSHLRADVVDLDGLTVMPKFVDAHAHLGELALKEGMVDLEGSRSLDELLGRLRSFAEAKPHLPVVFGYTFDHEEMRERRLPSASDLDRAVPDRPAIALRKCLHVGTINSAAMRLFDPAIFKPPFAELDEEGRPTGVVKEDLIWEVREKLSSLLSREDHLELMEEGLRRVSLKGVGAVGYVSCRREFLNVLLELEARGRLPMLVSCYMPPEELFDLHEALSLRGGLRAGNVWITGIKMFADGSLGARTAWLGEPYSDAPEGRGLKLSETSYLLEMASRAEVMGLQVAIHGIGDAAIDQILEVYGKLSRVRELRHRIEHASVLRGDQLERVADLGVALSVQPRFILGDWWVAQRVGLNRLRDVYRLKSPLRRGVLVGFGTDCPVERIDPWETVYAAVARGDRECLDLARHTPEERLTLEEALFCYTDGSSRIIRADGVVGGMGVGFRASFCAYEKDPFELDPSELKDLQPAISSDKLLEG